MDGGAWEADVHQQSGGSYGVLNLLMPMDVSCKIQVHPQLFEPQVGFTIAQGFQINARRHHRHPLPSAATARGAAMQMFRVPGD